MENAPQTGWEKNTKDEKSQGHQFRNPNPKTLEEVVENFNFLPKLFGFTQVQQLVFNTYSKIKLLKSQDEFKKFCIQHHALTPSGDIGTGKAMQGQRIPWAYAMFSELWNLVQNREAKKEYAEAKSWDEILDMGDEKNDIIPQLPF